MPRREGALIRHRGPTCKRSTQRPVLPPQERLRRARRPANARKTEGSAKRECLMFPEHPGPVLNKTSALRCYCCLFEIGLPFFRMKNENSMSHWVIHRSIGAGREDDRLAPCTCLEVYVLDAVLCALFRDDGVAYGEQAEEFADNFCILLPTKIPIEDAPGIQHINGEVEASGTVSEAHPSSCPAVTLKDRSYRNPGQRAGSSGV